MAIEIYWQDRGANKSDILLWSEDVQKIYDIVWTESGGRTDKLEFKIIPSYNSALANLRSPSIIRIVYIKDKDGKLFPFLVAETRKNMYNESTIYCASMGYIPTLSHFLLSEETHASRFYRRYASTHILNLYDTALERQPSSTPWSTPDFSNTNVSALPVFEFYERKDCLGKTCAELMDKVFSDSGAMIMRTKATYDSTSKKWTEFYKMMIPKSEASGTFYEISDYSAISNYEQTISLDNYYDGVHVYGKDFNGSFGRGATGTNQNHYIVTTLDTDVYEDVVTSANQLYSGVRFMNGATTSKIDVNPIICEPGNRRIRIFDCLHFVGVPPVTGWYMVKSIKRYIDNPSQTKFELVSVDAPAESDDRVYVKW